jgi:hypothetical protein
MLRAPASWSAGSPSKAFYRPRRWSTSSACARTSASEPSVSHPLCERSNRLLDEHWFDALSFVLIFPFWPVLLVGLIALTILAMAQVLAVDSWP